MRRRGIFLILATLLIFSGCSRPGSSWLVRVEAWTFGETEQIRSYRGLPRPMSPQKVRVCGKYVYLPTADAISAATRAVTYGEGSIMVHIQIKPLTQYKSYKIYRSSDGDVYSLIGERQNNPSFYETAYYLDSDGEFEALWFNDLDAALQINHDYYYRIKGVTSTGEEDSGREYLVQILPRFYANLEGPPNGGSINLNTTSNPVFSWTATGGFQSDPKYTIYLLYVLGSKDDSSSLLPFSWYHVAYGDEITWSGIRASIIYGTIGPDEQQAKPLVPGAIYEWDLAYACSAVRYTDMDFGESYAVSYSYPRITYGSSNGAYYFHTQGM